MQIHINQIMELLPHRYPFLLVDRIEEIIDTGKLKQVTGYKNVSFNEPFFPRRTGDAGSAHPRVYGAGGSDAP